MYDGWINLTPHEVTVIVNVCYGDLCPCDRGEEYEHEQQTIARIAPSGTVARLDETADCPDHIVGDCPQDPFRCVLEVALGKPAGLPEPDGRTTYIVSMPLLMGLAATGVRRTDVVYPYGQVRDAGGRIVGCRGFARLA